MGTSKVSSSFSKFLAKNATAVEEAKKAENSMQTCVMPVGWKGHAIVVGATADKGKDRKDDKGNTVEGNEYINIEFNVVNSEEYAGKKFSLHWSFYDSEKATAAQRFEWCLNEMENIGLPREIREEFTDITQVLDHFIKSDVVYDCEVVHNQYRRGDKKEVKVTLVQSVSNDSSMAPSSPTPTVEVGGKVSFMGKDWEVLAVDGDEIKIKSPTTGTERVIKASDMD